MAGNRGLSFTKVVVFVVVGIIVFALYKQGVFDGVLLGK